MELLKFVNRSIHSPIPAAMDQNAIEDTVLLSQIQGTRNKVLIIADMLLKQEACLRLVAHSINIVSTLKQILPCVDLIDKVWVLKMLNKIVLFKETNVSDICKDNGVHFILSLMQHNDVDITAEVLHLVKTCCAASEQKRQTSVLVERERSDSSCIAKPALERTGSSNSLSFGRVVSAVGDLMKLAPNKRPVSSRIDKTEELMQSKALILPVTFLYSEAARIKAAVEDREAKVTAWNFLLANEKSSTRSSFTAGEIDEFNAAQVLLRLHALHL